MFEAKTIMTTNVVSVDEQTEIYDAIRIMVENNITGLPVVNEDMSLVGVVSEKDVLKLLCNMEDKPGTVGGYMTRDPVCFNEDDSLVDIAECLMENNFRRVPILSQGKVVGIISRKDVIAYILKLRRQGQSKG